MINSKNELIAWLIKTGITINTDAMNAIERDDKESGTANGLLSMTLTALLSALTIGNIDDFISALTPFVKDDVMKNSLDAASKNLGYGDAKEILSSMGGNIPDMLKKAIEAMGGGSPRIVSSELDFITREDQHNHPEFKWNIK